MNFENFNSDVNPYNKVKECLSVPKDLANR